MNQINKNNPLYFIDFQYSVWYQIYYTKKTKKRQLSEETYQQILETVLLLITVKRRLAFMHDNTATSETKILVNILIFLLILVAHRST